MSPCQAQEVYASEKELRGSLVLGVVEKLATLSTALINLVRKRGVVADLQTRRGHISCLSPVTMIMEFQSVSSPSESHPWKDWNVSGALEGKDAAKV